MGRQKISKGLTVFLLKSDGLYFVEWEQREHAEYYRFIGVLSPVKEYARFFKTKKSAYYAACFISNMAVRWVDEEGKKIKGKKVFEVVNDA